MRNREKHNEASMRSYFKNRDRIRVKRKEAYKLNPVVRTVCQPNSKETATYLKAYREKNKVVLAEKDRERRKADPELYSKRQKEKRQRRLEAYRQKDKLRYILNHDEMCEDARVYSKKNRTKINVQRKKHIEDDVNFKLSTRLRVRLCMAIRKNSKSGSAVKDLGCSIPELRVYLESKFKLGMNWENWGRGKDKWHIDHIRPLASFDLTDRGQFLIACNFSNLQPMWESENFSKGSLHDGKRH